MCVILFKEKNIELSLETLKQVVATNPDGLGVCYLSNNAWIIKKFLSPSERQLKNIIKTLQGKKAILHSRIATSGKIDLKNCQPISDESMAIFHNGVISSLNGIDLNHSDTRLLFMLLKSNKNLNRAFILDNLAKKTGSKFVLLDYTKKEPLFFGAWQSYKGLKVSNKNFLPFEPIKYKYNWFEGDYANNNYKIPCYSCKTLDCGNCKENFNY